MLRQQAEDESKVIAQLEDDKQRLQDELDRATAAETY